MPGDKICVSFVNQVKALKEGKRRFVPSTYGLVSNLVNNQQPSNVGVILTCSRYSVVAGSVRGGISCPAQRPFHNSGLKSTKWCSG